MKSKIINILSTIIITSVISIGCGSDKRVSDANKLAQYLQSHQQSPQEYILSQFDTRDIIFLGELGKIKDDADLVRDIIPSLYIKGVRNLGYEYARREDQSLIDKLLSGKTFDDSLARQISFNYSVFWGYQEYIDIFKAAWQLNQSLPKDSVKFRILGLNDSPNWSLISANMRINRKALLGKVYHGQGQADWAGVISSEVIGKGGKALVFCNMEHAFTKYTPPVDSVKLDTVQMGNLIYRQIGDKTVTVMLYSPLPAKGYSGMLVLPGNGVVDEALAKIPSEARIKGFDLAGSPLADIKTGESYFTDSTATFGNFCNGIIVQKFLPEYQGVMPIEDFISESNLGEACKNASNPAYRTADIDRFMQTIAEEADIQGKFKYIRKAVR